MRFHLWRKSDRGVDDPVSCSTPRPDPSDQVDVDQWVDGGIEPEQANLAGEAVAAHGAVTLRDRLLAVLDDEEASLVPPSAVDMTQEEWNSLTDAEREGFRRLQLKRVDPRFVPQYTMNTRRSGSRSARVY